MLEVELPLALLLFVAGLADVNGTFRRPKLSISIFWLQRIATKVWQERCVGFSGPPRYINANVCTAGAVGFHITGFLNLIHSADCYLCIAGLNNPGFAAPDPQLSVLDSLRELVVQSPVLHVKTALARFIMYVNTPAAILFGIARLNLWLPRGYVEDSKYDMRLMLWLFLSSYWVPWAAFMWEMWYNPYVGHCILPENASWSTPEAHRKLEYNRDRFKFWRHIPV